MTVEKKMTDVEYVSQIQRIQAEFENYKKRTEKERITGQENANYNLILSLLPILDNFELALKHNDDLGVKMIRDELYKTLEGQGMETVKTNGLFNPNIHEAISQENGEKDGEIIEVIQNGYLLNGRLLRAAKVKITKVSK